MLLQETQSTWEAWEVLFWMFWGFLDMVFTGIVDMFIGIFDEMPLVSIPILVALACYAIMDFTKFIADTQEQMMGRMGTKVVAVIASIVALLFTLWRIGLVEMMDGSLSFETVSELAVTVLYIAFAIALVYAFMAQNGEKIRRGLQIILWASLFLTVFVFAPVFDAFEPSYHTMSQLLVSVLIFGTPKLLRQYQKNRDQEALEEDG